MKKPMKKEHERNETLFDRKCREERSKKLEHNDALFFGLTILLAVYATNMFTIQ